MITGHYWDICDFSALQRIDDAAMQLLTRGGVRVEHDGLLDRLEAAGCRVDRQAQRGYLRETLVREALAKLGGAPRMSVELESGWDAAPKMWHGGSHPHLLEWPSGERRLATCRDVTDMIKMAHTLDEFRTIGKVLTCSEVDQRIEPLWWALQAGTLTDKQPGSGEVFFDDYLDDLVAMAEVMTGVKGDTCLIPACDFLIQPLILERNQAACFVRKRELGLPVCPGTMAVAGMSGPITVAGVVTISIAELIAGWVLGYLINPELPATGIVATGSLDMQTMYARFGSPEAMLQNVATANMAQRLYGIGVWPIISYTDCKTPGIQAAFNKMFALMACPFTPSRGIGTDGLLSAGQDYSPVQHMLDNEMNAAIQRFWGHFDVTEDTIAADLIERMMRQPRTNFLDTEHTLLHHATELWYPRWFDRAPWQNRDYETGAERAMLERIDRYCKDAIARYEPPEVDNEKIAELERIFAAAEKRISGKSGALSC
jgi:trimethylamine---corrinoid protein Co-methyltransferase